MECGDRVLIVRGAGPECMGTICGFPPGFHDDTYHVLVGEDVYSKHEDELEQLFTMTEALDHMGLEYKIVEDTDEDPDT